MMTEHEQEGGPCAPSCLGMPFQTEAKTDSGGGGGRESMSSFAQSGVVMSGRQSRQTLSRQQTQEPGTKREVWPGVSMHMG